jgi:hypothetical protein
MLTIVSFSFFFFGGGGGGGGGVTLSKNETRVSI